MSPRNDEQNQQIRDERREQILQAALRVFAQKGYTATKISDIASQARLSHGLVYHYFSSKEVIFTELVRLALNMSIKVYADAAQLPLSPWDRLKTMTEAVVPYAFDGDGPYYFLIMTQAYISEAVPKEVKELIETLGPQYAEHIVKVIVEGQQTGEVAAGDPLEMAAAYFALINGLASSSMHGEARLPLPSPEVVLRIFRPAI